MNAADFPRVGLQDALPGDVCANAPQLVAGLLSNQATVGFQNDHGYSNPVPCSGGDSPDRVYRVTVPAQQRLTLTALPSANFDLALNLIDGPAQACDQSAHTCLQGVDAAPAGQEERLFLFNTSPLERTLFVLVDGALGTEGTFALNVELGPVPSGVSCELPDPLTVPANLTGTTLGFEAALDPHTSCTG